MECCMVWRSWGNTYSSSSNFPNGEEISAYLSKRSCITLNTFWFPLEPFTNGWGYRAFKTIYVQLWLSFSLAMPVSWFTQRQWVFLCFLPQDGEHTWIRTYLRMLSKGSLDTHHSLQSFDSNVRQDLAWLGIWSHICNLTSLIDKSQGAIYRQLIPSLIFSLVLVVISTLCGILDTNWPSRRWVIHIPWPSTLMTINLEWLQTSWYVWCLDFLREIRGRVCSRHRRQT